MKRINSKTITSLFTFVLLVLFTGCTKNEKRLRIAVASNFAPTLNKIATEFTKSTGIKVTLIPGSTGKLYAQIQNGAPYDIFLSADQARPKQLEDQNVANSRFTYAVGRLVLWHPENAAINQEFLTTDFKHLAIANPKLAPYGVAAKETLQKLTLWNKINHKIVIGENVSQAMHFAKIGNADAALICFSLVKGKTGNHWFVPEDMYKPIYQDACMLKSSTHAKAFINFLKSEAKNIILDDGYLSQNAK